eukprot:9130823-Pyramimonas_sp.AAC.1
MNSTSGSSTTSRSTTSARAWGISTCACSSSCPGAAVADSRWASLRGPPGRRQAACKRADSMAIMFMSGPGRCELRHGLGAVHVGPRGFLHSPPGASFHAFDCANGPGKTLQTHLPKAGAVAD